ncbi:MAG: PGPGW domain-containing protein [Solirubrobacteraceae bacterium]|nr:PGPGW domain-containing protein [Solirubrobacteraceae bacterium]
MATADPPKPRIIQRLEAQRERHRQRSFLVRVLYTIVGFTVLLVGLAMVVLPGPALIVIPIGLALLSLEFAWAEGMLERALEHAERAKHTARRTTTRQRVLIALAVALAIGGLIAWAIFGDIPYVSL